MIELKPCPFCGGEVELIREKGDQFEFVLVSCKNCNATIGIGGSDNKRKVTKAWNTRPNPWHTGTPTEEGRYIAVIESPMDEPFYVIAMLRKELNRMVWQGNIKPLAWQKIEPYMEK